MKHGTQYGYRKGCRCAECKAAKSDADKAFHDRNRESRNAQMRVYAEVHGVENRARAAAWAAANPERLRARVRRWQEENADRYQASRAEYARGNAELLRERARAYYRANPERFFEAARKRRALKTSLALPFTPAQLAQRLSMFAGCWVCGGDWNEVDHVKPLAKGGLHALCNLRPICGTCNRRKSARWPFAA